MFASICHFLCNIRRSSRLQKHVQKYLTYSPHPWQMLWAQVGVLAFVSKACRSALQVKQIFELYAGVHKLHNGLYIIALGGDKVVA